MRVGGGSMPVGVWLRAGITGSLETGGGNGERGAAGFENGDGDENDDGCENEDGASGGDVGGRTTGDGPVSNAGADVTVGPPS